MQKICSFYLMRNKDIYYYYYYYHYYLKNRELYTY